MNFPKYPAYKPSGIEWLGEVPAHWEVKRLRQVSELNPSKSEIAAIDRSTEASFLPMEAVGDDGRLNLDRTRPISEVESGYTYFREGDVTIAKITPCYENGKGAVMRGLHNGHGFGTTELIVIRPTPSKAISDYLHCLFSSSSFRNLGEAAMYGAGGQKRVPDDFVRDFAMAFPPLSEQSAIAAFLTRETAKIDALVAEQQKLIALLKEKRQAVISHAVTKGLDPSVPMKDSGVAWLGEVPAHWEVTRAKRVSSIFVPQRNKPELNTESDGVCWVTMDQMRDEEITSTELWVSHGAAIETGTRILDAGAVIASCVGSFGIAAINKFSVIINQQLQAFVPGRRIDVKFLRHYVAISQGYFEQIGTAATITYVNQFGFENMPLAIPSIEEQRKIVAVIRIEIDKLVSFIAEAQSAIALLQERRTALISAAVTGKIKVTVD